LCIFTRKSEHTIDLEAWPASQHTQERHKIVVIGKETVVIEIDVVARWTGLSCQRFQESNKVAIVGKKGFVIEVNRVGNQRRPVAHDQFLSARSSSSALHSLTISHGEQRRFLLQYTRYRSPCKWVADFHSHFSAATPTQHEKAEPKGLGFSFVLFHS
jgi:hypothetical protein